MRPAGGFLCLRSVLWFIFSIFTLLVRWQEGYPACKEHVPLIWKVFSGTGGWRQLRGNRLTQVHMENSCYSGDNCGHLPIVLQHSCICVLACLVCYNSSVEQYYWQPQKHTPVLYLLHLIVIMKYLPSVLWHCWLGGSKGIRPVKSGGGGHWLVRMEWRPAGWSMCLHLLIFPCTIKSRSSLLAPPHPGGPGKRAVKRLWWVIVIIICIFCAVDICHAYLYYKEILLYACWIHFGKKGFRCISLLGL